MIRILAFTLAAFVAWSAGASPSPEPDPTTPAPAETHEEPPATLETRSHELLAKHAEIWALMDLSESARNEIDGLVVAINAKVYENQHEHPEEFAKAVAVKRANKALTHDEFVAGHTRRFGLLGISEPTREELLAALELTWTALHDPDVPEEKREVAMKIGAMMRNMGGPPPCCDDNIFERAGMARQESER